MSSTINKRELISKLQTIEGLTNEERSNLIGLLRQHKKYGLVWEDKPEDVEERLREELPVFREVKDKAILSAEPDAPNHILIEGDNLEALTALSYTHEGKIDVIYIDPPYNTGNKDFVYNDSFVDTEDSYRHSKWLSFMNKRLKIAKKLLSDKGVIFISIDDNEQANLKLLCDEVFGYQGFFTSFAWVNSVKEEIDNDTRFAGANLGKLKKSYEYVLAYSKSDYKINADQPSSKYIDKLITNSSNNNSYCVIPKGVKCVEPISKIIYGRVGGNNDYYDIVSPEGMIIENGVLQNDVRIYGPLRNSQSLERFFKGETIIDHKGQKLIGVFLSKGGMLHTRKLRVGNTPSTVLVGKGTTKNGTLLLKEMFNGVKPFDFSKPIELIGYLISKQKGQSFTILDFFAGSGTTLHATMQLNAEDGGHRQCILVTNNENNICEEVTYERNKRVIKGYTTPKGVEVAGLKGNTLRYYKTDYISRDRTQKNMRDLVAAATDLLCIKEDLYEEQKTFGRFKLKPQLARYFNDGKVHMLIIYREELIDEIAEEIAKLDFGGKRLKIYVFSPGRYAFTDNFSEVEDKVELVALPAAIYDAYQKVLPKRKEKLFEEEKEVNAAPISQDLFAEQKEGGES